MDIMYRIVGAVFVVGSIYGIVSSYRTLKSGEYLETRRKGRFVWGIRKSENPAKFKFSCVLLIIMNSLALLIFGQLIKKSR